MKDLIENAITKINGVAKGISATQVLTTFEMLMEGFCEIQSINRDIVKIEAVRDCVLSEIEKKYNFYHTVFDKIFSERKEAIDKYFSIIDMGLKNGNNELVFQGMRELANVVVSSPFKDAGEFLKQIDSNKTIEI